jgi:Flp pilus assembly secretin CpaC
VFEKKMICVQRTRNVVSLLFLTYLARKTAFQRTADYLVIILCPIIVKPFDVIGGLSSDPLRSRNPTEDFEAVPGKDAFF